MAYTGAKSQVELGIEGTFATAATLTYTLPVKSESINYKMNPIKSEALLKTRGVKAMAVGTEGAEGGLELEAYPSSTGLLFYLALGTAVAKDPDETANSGDEYSKIAPIGVNDELPSATIQVDHAGKKMLYTGMKVNNLKFSGAVGSIPTINLDFIGVDETVGGGTEGTLTAVDAEPFYFKDLKIYTDKFTTSTDMYSSIELSIANNLDDKDYRLNGTGKRKTIAANALSITGSLDILFDSSTVTGEYGKFKSFSDVKIGIELAKGTDKISIYLPRVKFTEMTHDISGPDKIVLKANFETLIPSTGDIIEVDDYINTTGNY